MTTKTINWEDHIGLCHLAADIMIRSSPALRPYKNEVVDDLIAKLWMIANYDGFDPSLGFKESTYLTRSLLQYKRYILKVHLRKEQYVLGAPIGYEYDDHFGDAVTHSECSLEKKEDKEEILNFFNELPPRMFEQFRIHSNVRRQSRVHALKCASGNSKARTYTHREMLINVQHSKNPVIRKMVIKMGASLALESSV